VYCELCARELNLIYFGSFRRAGDKREFLLLLFEQILAFLKFGESRQVRKMNVMVRVVQTDIPKSNGCVHIAAKQLALPPNQKGYLICFFVLAFTFTSAFRMAVL